MGTFETVLDWKVLPSGRRRLNEPLLYTLDKDLADELGQTSITVPGSRVEGEEGFVTDGYSFPLPAGCPRLLGGKYEVAPEAAVGHDWLCEAKICGRYLTDRIFKRMMKDCGVGWIRRNIIYAGVRAYAIATGLK